ncbi:MAG: proline--tRNA ligase [Candidatus Hodarchaeota archaeon]
MSEELGMTVKKADFSEWFSEVCQKAELADLRYNIQGFIVHRPRAMRIIKRVYEFYERELEKTGHEPVLFPVVIPEENLLKEAEHVKGFAPEVFWVTHAGDKKLEKRLALRPTSETAMYQMYSLWVRSHRDLPLKLYQSVAVYRNEMTTRPFLRGREFLWIEAHDVFRDHDGVMKQVKEDMEIARTVIHDILGIPFFFFRRPQWDKFPGAVDTYASDTLMPDGKVNQLSSTHDLGMNFAKVFNVEFVNEEGKLEYAWQTCYGPGIWRIMAALIAIHGDDKGLVLPFVVSPTQIVIVPILTTDKQIMMKCQTIQKTLTDAGFRVHLDIREETPGYKYNDWELKGVPLRIEIGQREISKDFVTLHRRDIGERIEINDTELTKRLKNVIQDYSTNLKKRAKESFDKGIVDAKTKEDVIEILEKRSGFARMGFCGREECAMDLKETTNGGKVRGTLLEKQEKPKGNCAWCEGKAKEIVYVAKAY